MRPDRFRQLLDAPGPFVSVYFDDSRDSDDQLELKWQALRDELRRKGADDAVTEEIGRAVKEPHAPAGHSGRALIADSTGVIVDEHLLRPTPQTVVRVSALPYILPILELGFDSPRHLLVELGHFRANITVRNDGQVSSETVDGGDHPARNTSGAHRADAGSRISDAAQHNIRAVADRVSELVDDTAVDPVFLVGEVRSRSDLLAALPVRVRNRAIPLDFSTGHDGYTAAEIKRSIDSVFFTRQIRVIDEAAERFTAEVGRDSGRAAEGLDAVCAALRQGTVDTLIIGEINGATVVTDAGLTAVAPNAHTLSAHGATAAATLRADEALPLLAVSAGATLVRTDERIAPADGVGAVLRHAAVPH